MSRLDILYRGPLASCNYACGYCPFAKRKDTRQTLHRDAMALARFLDWATGQTHRRLGVFFTPWGEALIRPTYRKAMVRLSWMSHVRKVAAQTNLSWPTPWLRDCDPARVGLWCTYHPGETALRPFLRRCAELDALGIGYSVGIVGKKEHFAAVKELREALRPDVYVWINAYRDEGCGYYDAGDVAFLAGIDPLFPVNLTGVRSRGKACATGETVIAVDGEGEARRCQVVPGRIGNIYDPAFDTGLTSRPCPVVSCRCHIGYAHMPALEFQEIFGDCLLERVPRGASAAGRAQPVAR